MLALVGEIDFVTTSVIAKRICQNVVAVDEQRGAIIMLKCDVYGHNLRDVAYLFVLVISPVTFEVMPSVLIGIEGSVLHLQFGAELVFGPGELAIVKIRSFQIQ